MNCIVKNPYINGYCEKCKFHYLDSNDVSGSINVSKCKSVTYCSIHIICGAILQCSGFAEKNDDKDGE